MDTILTSFDRGFTAVNDRSIALLNKIRPADLYRRPRELPHSMAMFSCGEYLLRSSAAVEQTFGGITTRLWDDPFEWTLPEKLATRDAIREYLAEVEETRRAGFGFLKSDADLLKQIPAPEALRSIFDLLLDTLARAEHFQGRAFSVFQMFSDEKLPRV